MDIDNIKSVTLSKLNNEPISIVFELHGKNQINWKTRDRTKELYTILININSTWAVNGT